LGALDKGGVRMAVGPAGNNGTAVLLACSESVIGAMGVAGSSETRYRSFESRVKLFTLIVLYIHPLKRIFYPSH